jgi:hypothetical protein
MRAFLIVCMVLFAWFAQLNTGRIRPTGYSVTALAITSSFFLVLSLWAAYLLITGCAGRCVP